MVDRQFAQDSRSFWREADGDFAAVLGDGAAPKQSALFQPVHQFDSAVVLYLQTLGQAPMVAGSPLGLPRSASSS